MRRYSKISGMHLITCSARDCTEEFRSASVAKVIDAQLEAAQWTILETLDPRTGEKRRHELCPAHRPKGRMSGGPPPLSVSGRASH